MRLSKEYRLPRAKVTRNCMSASVTTDKHKYKTVIVLIKLKRYKQYLTISSSLKEMCEVKYRFSDVNFDCFLAFFLQKIQKRFHFRLFLFFLISIYLFFIWFWCKHWLTVWYYFPVQFTVDDIVLQYKYILSNNWKTVFYVFICVYTVQQE